jgi:hypothetical protein
MLLLFSRCVGEVNDAAQHSNTFNLKSKVSEARSPVRANGHASNLESPSEAFLELRAQIRGILHARLIRNVS